MDDQHNNHNKSHFSNLLLAIGDDEISPLSIAKNLE